MTKQYQKKSCYHCGAVAPANEMIKTRLPKVVNYISSPKMSLWTFIGIPFSRDAARTFGRWFWKSSSRKYQSTGRLVWTCKSCVNSDVLRESKSTKQNDGVSTEFLKINAKSIFSNTFSLVLSLILILTIIILAYLTSVNLNNLVTNLKLAILH